MPAFDNFDRGAGQRPREKIEYPVRNHLVADGNVSIRSITNHDADGKVFSVSTGGAAFGASWVDVKVRPTVDTYIGANATVEAGGTIALLSLHNRDAVTLAPLTTMWNYLGNDGVPTSVEVNRGARAYGEAPAVAYVPILDDAAVLALTRLTSRHMVVAYCATPDLLRDRLALPGVAIEQAPDRLLAEFPRIVAGL